MQLVHAERSDGLPNNNNVCNRHVVFRVAAGDVGRDDCDTCTEVSSGVLRHDGNGGARRGVQPCSGRQDLAVAQHHARYRHVSLDGHERRHGVAGKLGRAWAVKVDSRWCSAGVTGVGSKNCQKVVKQTKPKEQERNRKLQVQS